MTNTSIARRSGSDWEKLFSRMGDFIVGFDRPWWDQVSTLTDTQTSTYPPFNLIRVDDNHYHLELAVAGFDPSELSADLEKNVLTIRGKRIEETDVSEDGNSGKTRVYINRGISSRSFTRSFMLTDNVHVEDATIKNGLLIIDLVRVIPEEMKPKLIEIKV